MTFRYYITDTLNGCIKGTDDDHVALDLSQSEDFFVVDTKTGEWLTVGPGREQIGDISADS